MQGTEFLKGNYRDIKNNIFILLYMNRRMKIDVTYDANVSNLENIFLSLTFSGITSSMCLAYKFIWASM